MLILSTSGLVGIWMGISRRGSESCGFSLKRQGRRCTLGPIMVIGGARPNFVKVAPVLGALEAGGLACRLVHSGQHYDARMSGVFFDELGIRPPDHVLSSGSGSHARQTAAVMIGLEELLVTECPEAVVVFGDVNSTVASALVTAKFGSRVVHVEAGLRSRDWSMPEEINRVVTDRVSDLLLAPSDDAADNLRIEGFGEQSIRVVGNVMIDSLLANLDRARERPSAIPFFCDYALVTVHRPSNVDNPEVLARIIAAVARVSEDVPVLWPVHPRARSALAGENLPSGVVLTEPLGYLDFIAAEAGARVVLTDSGGVQEETTVLGVPCLTLRDNTERPITITEGTNRLVGTDPSTIWAAVQEVLANPPIPRRPSLWDGRAGGRCGAAIAEMLATPDWPRPSDVS